MQFNAQVSESVVIGIDMPGPLRVKRFGVDVEAGSEEELREALEWLGGADAFHMDPSSHLVSRFSVPVTCDGEEVATMTVNVWLSEELRQPAPVYEPIQRLLEERKAHA